MTLDDAVQIAARGFAYVRSFTHPYLVEDYGKILLLHDAPRRRADYRGAELMGANCSATDAQEAIHRAQLADIPMPRFAVCIATPAPGHDEELKLDFKAHGYTLNRTEGVYALNLEHEIRTPHGEDTKRVTTPEEMERLNGAARKRQILPEHLGGETLRAYIHPASGAPVGWVRSVHLDRHAASVSNMYVSPEHRRQGIARSLMSQMLVDDQVAGVHTSVLFASHTGALLYECLGYQRLGTLHVFIPPESR